MTDPGISRQLFVYRDRERALGRILRQLITEGAHVLDVGGNLGYYPIMEARLVGPSGRVIVMEPVPSNFEALARNIRLNHCERWVECHQIAAYDQPGKTRFYVSDATNLGTLFPDTSDIDEQRYLTGNYVEVETIDLSTFIASMGSLALIRMDPEGAEVGILRGLMPSIRSGVFDGRIVTEIHPRQYDAQTNDIRPVLEDLFSCGYYAEIVTSVDEADSFLGQIGYRAVDRIRESNRVVRGIYRDVGAEHVIDAVVRVGAVRDLVLARPEC